MKRLGLTLAFLVALFAGCQKSYNTSQLTGKDWVVEYTDDNNQPNYMVYRFYDDYHFVEFDLYPQSDPDKQDIIIDGTGYQVDYTIYTWSWIDDDHTKLYVEYDGSLFTLRKTYEIEQLGLSSLILKKLDAPESLIFDKDNDLLKGTKFEYQPFYDAYIANQ